MKCETITGLLGLEIQGLDLSKPLGESTAAELRRLWAEHQVLVFRGQTLGDADFLRFVRLFGPVARNYFFFPQVEQQPEIAKVLKTPSDALNTGGVWHHDQGYYREPVRGIALYGVQIPSSGGDTLFASLTAAHAALSPALQGFLCGLQVIHSTRLMLAKKKQVGQSPNVARLLDSMPEESETHPLVCMDPHTGKPFLYVNRTTTEAIVGLRPEESAALLELLFRHVERHEFTCRVKWRPGTLVLWNNHSCLHHAVNDYQETRELHRIHFMPQRPSPYRMDACATTRSAAS